VAEMVGRKDKSNGKHVQVRKFTSKVRYVVIGMIISNYLVQIGGAIIPMRFDNEHHDKLTIWTTYYIPSVFLLIDCIVLIIGMAVICAKFKHNYHVMGDARWMSVHAALMIINLGNFVYLYIKQFVYRNPNSVY
jgi:hypothetical protein